MSKLRFDCFFLLCQCTLSRFDFRQFLFEFTHVRLQIPKLRPHMDFR